MKLIRLAFLICFFGFFIITGCDATSENIPQITVMTYNIKYDNKSDDATGWSQRKSRVTNLVSFYQPDFLGTQEGLKHQLDDMERELDSMQWIGVGRTDGKSKGEFSALFYNTRRFALVEDSDSTIWLSQTPAQPSKNWDAALPRILTWAKFRDKLHGDQFFVFNTHFDHVGDTARAQSAKLIIKTINKIARDHPVILMGDFNVTPDAKPYAILTADHGLNDSHILAKGNHIGPDFTFSGFEVDAKIEPKRIDYIFLSDDLMVNRHGTISDFNKGYYPSDHLPVISEIKISSN